MYYSNKATYPFAVRTNNDDDVIKCRLLTWDAVDFGKKLSRADRIEGYSVSSRRNLYERSVVDVIRTEDGEVCVLCVGCVCLLFCVCVLCVCCFVCVLLFVCCCL